MEFAGDLKEPYVRLALPADEECMVEIYNLHEADSVPQTPERLQAERAPNGNGPPGEHYVAEAEGTVAGYGGFQWAWWTGQLDIYMLEIRVDPHYTRRGLGTHLYETLRSRLVSRGATQFVAWVRQDAEAGRAFAVRVGCTETGQIIQEYRLDISHADTSSLPEAEARLDRQGLRLACLADLERENTTFLQALQRLWADAGDQPPDKDQLRNSFESWQQEVLHAPGLSPDTHWIALDGERPVGMTFLKRLSETAFENDYTGVASAYRGRGIATALKQRAIAWAQQQGVHSFHTSSEVGNKSMIAINTRLGYRPGVQRVEVTCLLA